MNGRVYDPYTARFLSADPHVTDPTNGQNYNRYSYVLNNPTNLTDPTGFDWRSFQLAMGWGSSAEAADRKENATSNAASASGQRINSSNTNSNSPKDGGLSADSGIRAGQPASEGCSDEMPCVVITGQRQYPSIKYNGNTRTYFDNLALAPAQKSTRQVIHEAQVAIRNNNAHAYLATGRVESQSADLLLLALGGPGGEVVDLAMAGPKVVEAEGLIYRAASGTPSSLTPRLVDVNGLSAATSLESKALSGKIQIIDTSKLTNLCAICDNLATGHVSIYPKNMGMMPGWISSRGGTEIHPLTQELMDAVVGTARK